MQAQEGFAVVRTFVHVVHPEAGCVVEMRGEWKVPSNVASDRIIERSF